MVASTNGQIIWNESDFQIRNKMMKFWLLRVNPI